VTLGTGKVVQRDLVPFHAYGVIGLREEKGERVLEIVDPGSTPRQSDGVLEESMDQLSLKPKEGESNDSSSWARLMIRLIHHDLGSGLRRLRGDQSELGSCVICKYGYTALVGHSRKDRRLCKLTSRSWSKKPDEAEARESGQGELRISRS
jgi:hypothetical protein